MFDGAKKNADGILNVTCEDLLKNLDAVSLVDVRREEEFHGELGHIQGAVLSTLETKFSEDVKRLDSTKPIVFICRSGVRSLKASAIAKEAGLSDVYNLEGGMLRWNELGYKVD